MPFKSGVAGGSTYRDKKVVEVSLCIFRAPRFKERTSNVKENPIFQRTKCQRRTPDVEGNPNVQGEPEMSSGTPNVEA
jgi:hypothetical protein